MSNGKLKLGIVFLLFLTINLFTSSCNDVKKESSVLKIVFDQKIKDKPFEFGKFIYKSKSGYTYKATTLRYFTSNFKIFKKDGSFVELDTFHYREFGKKYNYTRELVIDNFSPGEYIGISFIHGLDKKYNKSIKGTEAHSLPNVDEYLDMYWPWQKDGQYHYMKYEGAYINESDTLSFKLHTGPTNGAQNYVIIDKIPFTTKKLIKGDTMIINLEMDLNEWIENPMLFDFKQFGKGIMKVQEAQDILKANGKNVYSVKM
jgi:hypothetical protein